MERVERTLSVAGLWRRKTGGGSGWGIFKQVGIEIKIRVGGSCQTVRGYTLPF